MLIEFEESKSTEDEFVSTEKFHFSTNFELTHEKMPKIVEDPKPGHKQ